MTKKELTELKRLSEKLYTEEQEKTGMCSPIPYAWMEHEGFFIAVSSFGKYSIKLKKILEKNNVEIFYSA